MGFSRQLSGFSPSKYFKVEIDPIYSPVLWIQNANVIKRRKVFNGVKMIYPIFLLVVTCNTVFVIYKMLEHLNIKNNFARNEAGILSGRLYVSSLVRMFSAWFLYWLCLVSTASAQGRKNPYAGKLPDINIIPLGVMGIAAGIMVGLLSRKWNK